MKRTSRLRTASVSLVLAALALRAEAQDSSEPEPAGPDHPPPPPVAVLVNADLSVPEAIKDAEAAAGSGDVDRAVEILQGLLLSERKTFVRRGEDPRLYGSAHDAINRSLASLPAAAIERYARRFEAPARKLLEDAEKTQDEVLLRRLAREYFHTESGRRALDRLGALAFDRGSFLDAAEAWMALATVARARTSPRPLLLAKAAVAYHLAGAASEAASAGRRLRGEHPDARAAIAGNDVRLEEFVASALAAPPELAAPPRPPVGSWTSFAGAPEGIALQPAWDAIPAPLWIEPTATRLARVQAIFGGAARAALEAGRVVLSLTATGAGLTVSLPALVHPLVIGDVAIVRREDEVVAVALADGRERWRTSGLPLHGTGGRAAPPAHPYLPLAGDMGRYALAAGDGLVFTVCGLRQIDPATFVPVKADSDVDGSILAAVKLQDRPGDVAWTVGRGRGDADLVKKAKFLSAPAWHGNRLYVAAKHAGDYHAICLDARTGVRVWSAPIGPIPAPPGDPTSWQAAAVMEMLTERAAPPAVADGLALFATNLGVVAAFDAATGSPVWAHRYDSRLIGPATAEEIVPIPDLAYLLPAIRRPLDPVNPVVVSVGRVVVLPADSAAVLCLNARTGAPLWRADRAGQQDLTALDDARLLLSGPDLVVLRMADGVPLATVRADVLDRPAVTPAAVLAPSRGRILRMHLGTYAVDPLPIEGSDALLGRLLTEPGGMLIAANAAGLSAYWNFDKAWSEVGRRLEKARNPAERLDARLQRGRLAFDAGRLEAAEEELRAADREARAVGGDTPGRVRSILFLCLLRRAAASRDDARAGAWLDEARTLAGGLGGEALVTLQAVRYHESFGRPDRAVEQAQFLAERFADVLVPDVTIGDGAAGSGLLRGAELARREIDRLLRAHGRPAYARLDRAANEAIREATARENIEALLTACRRWPHAARAGETLVALAERLYRRAADASAIDAALAVRAHRVLGELKDADAPALRLRARAAQALIDARVRPYLLPAGYADLRAADPSTPVEFAGWRGTLGALLDRFAKEAPPPGTVEPAVVAPPTAPLRQAGCFRERHPVILRDTAGAPVRLGERAFLVAGNDVVCLDTQRRDPAAAALWRASLAAPPAGRAVGQLAADHRTLAVLDPQFLTGIDAADGRVRYRVAVKDTHWHRAGGERNWIAAAGPWGKWLVVHIPTGANAWDGASLSRPPERFQIRGQILLAFRERGREVVCHDVRNGEILVALTDRQRMEAALTPEGLLLEQGSDGVLRLIDPRRGRSGTIWELGKESAPWALTILGVGARFAVAREGGAGGVLRAVDLADPARAITLDLPADSSGPAIPVRAAVDGVRAFLLFGALAGGPGADDLDVLRAPRLVAFDLSSGRRLWDRPLAPTSDGPCRVSGPDVAAGTVAARADPRDAARPDRVFVLAAETGKPIYEEPADPRAAATAPPADRHTPSRPGSPAVFDQAVAVETEDGVVWLEGER